MRTGSDYGLTTTSSNLSTLLPLVGITATLWGVPADSSHDAVRTCPNFVSPCPSTGAQTPLLTLPTSCTANLKSTLSADSWQTPGVFSSASSDAAGTTGSTS